MKPRLSASGLWRAEKCPASTVLPPARTDHADAEAGREDHSKMEDLAPPGSTPEAAYALDAVSGAARYLGSKLGRNYPPTTQTEIVGTADLVIVEPELVRVRDYKSGHGYMVSPPAKNPQLGHNALCAAKVNAKTAAVVEVEMTATGEVRSAPMDAFDLAAMEERIRAIWREAQKAADDLEAGKQPRIVEGEHCWRCECYARCPAKTTLALTIANGELPTHLPTLELTPLAVASGWERLKAAKKLLSEVERIYRGYAAENAVPLGNGRFLGEVVKGRDAVDGAVAYEVLKQRFGEEIARKAVEMDTSKAAIERAIGPHAPPRGKAAQMKLTMEAIEAAGGVHKDFTRRIEEYEDRGAESAA